MTANTPMIRATAAPLFDPGAGRSDLELPAGLTIAEIVCMALPGLSDAARQQARVLLVTASGSAAVPSRLWHAVRPKPGVHVVIRLIPRGDALRSILSIVVSIAAIALGGPLAGMLGVTSTLGVSLVTAGLTVVGNLLINALIPPPKQEDAKNSYTINGWRNALTPDGAVPVVLGTMRYAPPFAAMSWSEIVGDVQYVRALFTFGYGPLNLTDFRIGETSLSDYDGVEIEVRDGLASDLPVTQYPRQIVEENIGAELTRPLPRDELGEVIDDEPGEETPVVRTTGPDASGVSIILSFAGGLVRFSKSGKARPETVVVRIEQRLAQAEEWQLVETLEITAKKIEGFFRQHTWQFPSRGRYQVRLTMMTDETESSQVQRRCTWAALQTLRPEYPLAFGHPLALLAVRVKATHQINGQLDTVNALAARRCLDWDHVTEAWIERVTSNPASLFRYVLQSPANPRPAGDAVIDLDQLQDWHDFCRIKGLTYNRILESADSTLRDVLIEVAAAGRASPRHDGVRWGVTIDRPSTLVVDHITPRNSWAFSCHRNYIQPPHALRVPFRDAANDYKTAERLIPWPGHVGPIELTEVYDMPGKTDAAEVWREARRRQYEVQHRPDSYEVTQDGPARVAARGDLVMLQSNVLDQIQRAARVRFVAGPRIELDELVQMEPGADYAIRFRRFADEEDTIGVSVLRSVRTDPGETQILTLSGEGDLPLAGDLVLFGTLGSEAISTVVRGVEAGGDLSSIMRLVAAAPIIDELLAADDIPAWSGRVGAEIDENLLQPSAPRFVQITSGVAGTEDADRVEYLIAPGPSAFSAAHFDIDHRLSGAGGWTTIRIPAANGGGAITSYGAGNALEMRARAVSFADVAGPYTPVVAFTVGAGDAAIPAALDADTVVVTSRLGGATIAFGTGADASVAQVQLYRALVPTLDRETDAVGNPASVVPQRSYSLNMGDTGRVTVAVNGTFASAASWTLGTGWSIGSGVATKAAGVAAAISQAQTLTAGKWYRLSFRVTSWTAGTITPVLQGGSDRPGTARGAVGTHYDRIQAVSGNTTLALLTSADFAGSIDDVVIFQETAACLAQATHYLWLEPQNADGVPGPVAGPFTVIVT